MLSLVESHNKANIFLGLIEYELNSLLGVSHLVNYILVHIRFDLERYLLNTESPFSYSDVRADTKHDSRIILVTPNNSLYAPTLKQILTLTKGVTLA